jgi:site-specific recombinase XerD
MAQQIAYCEAAGFPFLVHSHMLRHSCGYKLANDGQDTRAIQHYLGHKSINSTVRYTAHAGNSSDVVRITRELCLPAFKHDPHASYAWHDR